MDNTFCIPFIDDASIENVLNCLAAVSYTHLDVYKRQIFTLRCNCIMP